MLPLAVDVSLQRNKLPASKKERSCTERFVLNATTQRSTTNMQHPHRMNFCKKDWSVSKAPLTWQQSKLELKKSLKQHKCCLNNWKKSGNHGEFEDGKETAVPFAEFAGTNQSIKHLHEFVHQFPNVFLRRPLVNHQKAPFERVLVLRERDRLSYEEESSTETRDHPCAAKAFKPGEKRRSSVKPVVRLFGLSIESTQESSG